MEATSITHIQRMDAKKHFGRYWLPRIYALDAARDVFITSRQEAHRLLMTALLAIAFARRVTRKRQPTRWRSALSTVAFTSGKTKPANGETRKRPPKRTSFGMIMKDAPTPSRATSKLTGPPLPDATTALPKLGARAPPRSDRFVLRATRAIFRLWPQNPVLPYASVVCC